MTEAIITSFYKTAIAVLLFSVFVKSEVIIDSYAGQEASGCPYIVQRGGYDDAQHTGLAYMSDLTFDANGNAYYGVSSCGAILFHERSSNLVSVVAGYPDHGGLAGDNGAATAAQVGWVMGLKIDPDGRFLYFGDSGIRRIDLSSRLLTRVAGNGQWYNSNDWNGDNGAATSAAFGDVNGMHFNTARYLFVTDGVSRIRKIDMETGIVTNYAGNPFVWRGHQDGPLTSAMFNMPMSMWAEDGAFSVTLFDSGSCSFRKLDMVTGMVSTWWGGQDCLSAGDDGNIVDATAYYLVSICGKDTVGNFYFADEAQDLNKNLEGGCSIRKIDPSGKITRYAGTKCENPYNGEGILARNANLRLYLGGCAMYDDKVYFTDNQTGGNARIRVVYHNQTDMPSVATTHHPSYLPSYLPSYGPTFVVPTVAPSCYWSAEDNSCGGSLEEVVVSSTSTNVNRAGNSTSRTTVTRTYRKRA